MCPFHSRDGHVDGRGEGHQVVPLVDTSRRIELTRGFPGFDVGADRRPDLHPARALSRGRFWCAYVGMGSSKPKRRARVRQCNVTVNCIAPGLVNTEATEK